MQASGAGRVHRFDNPWTKDFKGLFLHPSPFFSSPPPNTHTRTMCPQQRTMSIGRELSCIGRASSSAAALPCRSVTLSGGGGSAIRRARNKAWHRRVIRGRVPWCNSRTSPWRGGVYLFSRRSRGCLRSNEATPACGTSNVHGEADGVYGVHLAGRSMAVAGRDKDQRCVSETPARRRPRR